MSVYLNSFKLLQINEEQKVKMPILSVRKVLFLFFILLSLTQICLKDGIFYTVPARRVQTLKQELN